MNLSRAPRAAFTAVATALLSCLLSAQDNNTLVVRVGGALLPSSSVLAVVVDESLMEPPTAAVALRPGSAPPAVGRGLDIAAVDGEIVFQGEVVAIESFEQTSGTPVVIVRARDRLHRLDGDKQTRTFTGVSDIDVARQLAAGAGLRVHAAGVEASTPHSAIHQHDQTDLAFLKQRAAAIGYVVFTDGDTLHFEQRRLVPQAILGCGIEDIRVRALLAWLASPDQVQQVDVRGWDPVIKQDIIAKARRPVIGLSRAASTIEPPSAVIDLGFVETLHTAAIAHAAAAGVLAARTEHDLSAEMAVDGVAALRAHAEVILHGAGDAFNGKYLVQGVSHRYHSGAGGGWQTLLRVVREDRGVYVRPETGDEVLVAFEQGDLNRPVVAGSLWSSPPPPDASPCRRRAGPVLMPGER